MTDTPDAALIETGREIAEVCALIKAEEDLGLNAPGDSHFNRFDALEETICTTPALTLAGVAVKLRRLADPGQGIGTTENPLFMPALVQAIARIEHAGDAPPPPPPGEVTALANQAEEFRARANEADKQYVSNQGDTEALGKEVTTLCESESRTRHLAIMEPAVCWGEIGIKLEQVLTNAGVLAHAHRPDDLDDAKSIEHMLAEGIRQVLRDTVRLASAA